MLEARAFSVKGKRLLNLEIGWGDKIFIEPAFSCHLGLS